MAKKQQQVRKRRVKKNIARGIGTHPLYFQQHDRNNY